MKRPEAVGDILERLLKSYGLDGKLREWKAMEAWPQVVGEGIARHTKPEKVFRKRLYILVDSSAWMQQLHFLKQDIVVKLNAAVGQEVVKEIHLKVGKIEP